MPTGMPTAFLIGVAFAAAMAAVVYLIGRCYVETMRYYDPEPDDDY